MCGIDEFLSRLRGEDNGLHDQFSLFILLAVFNGESSPAMVTLQYILINSVCNLEMTMGEKEIRIKQRAKGRSNFQLSGKVPSLLAVSINRSRTLPFLAFV